MTSPKFIIVDLFCGAGGTTTGFSMTNGIAKVIACVNHDPKAIKSHWLNHPEVAHYEEDIRTLHLSGLKHIVRHYRKKYPTAKLILWASLECTNFSKAKGGQPRDADSRTLADHLDRYVLAIKPDYIQIENVVEFMSWGPLDENGKPVSRKNGSDWMRWRNRLCSYGYRDEWKQLNSADYGSYTSRNRLFGIFAKGELPIAWPAATHSKTPSVGELFGRLEKWKAVKDVLDFEDEGQSIFNRKKPLVDASLERIYSGLIKFVAGGRESFLLKYNSLNKQGKVVAPSTDEPPPTIACQNRLGIVQTYFIAKYFSGRPMNKIASIDNPLATITTAANQALVNVEPFVLTSSYKGVSKSIEEPVPTLLASRKHHYLINPCFLTKYYGNEKGCESINEPLDTIPTKDRFSLIQAHWLDKQYSGSHNHRSIDQPAGTIMTSEKHALMTAMGFIYNPSHGGHTMHINQPCPVIIARQDKSPLYIIQLKSEPIAAIPVYDDDSKVMIRIKEFMAMYGIADIKMRMLKVSELLKIQGFPSDYKLVGSQTDQKKFIGNSVVPDIVKAWAIALAGVQIKSDTHEQGEANIRAYA